MVERPGRISSQTSKACRKTPGFHRLTPDTLMQVLRTQRLTCTHLATCAHTFIRRATLATHGPRSSDLQAKCTVMHTSSRKTLSTKICCLSVLNSGCGYRLMVEDSGHNTRVAIFPTSLSAILRFILVTRI